MVLFLQDTFFQPGGQKKNIHWLLFKTSLQRPPLKVAERIYLRVGYVFESRFSTGMIQPISMIFGILNKEWSNFKKMLFIFLQV